MARKRRAHGTITDPRFFRKSEENNKDKGTGSVEPSLYFDLYSSSWVHRTKKTKVLLNFAKVGVHEYTAFDSELPLLSILNNKECSQRDRADNLARSKCHKT